MKKKMFLVCLGLLFGVLTAMAQSTTHVVKRGETLTMIATQYDVSVDALKEANPLVGKTLFVGMKLQIPEKETASAPQSVQQEAIAAAPEQPTTTTLTQAEYTTKGYTDLQKDNSTQTPLKQDYRIAQGAVHAYGRAMFYFTDHAFGKSDSENGAMDYKSDFVLAWDMGANYYFIKSAFVYAGLGVESQGGTYSYSSGYGATTYTTNTSRTSLRLPLGAGYHYPFTENIGITAQTGPMLNYLIAGSDEEKESGKQVNKIKLKDMKNVDRFSANWSASIGVNLWDFEIGAEYCIGLNEHAADMWGVYLGFRF